VGQALICADLFLLLHQLLLLFDMENNDLIPDRVPMRESDAETWELREKPQGMPEVVVLRR
jgi:hypothetical protein